MSETKPQIPAGQPDKVNGTATVIIGCKLPNGLVCEMGKYGDENYTRVILNGANSSRVVGGYGLTTVSLEFWNAWYKKSKHLEFVRKGLIFAHGDDASAADHAKDHASVLTGLEPLDPVKDLAKVKGLDGKPLVEVDQTHFSEGQQAMRELGGGRMPRAASR